MSITSTLVDHHKHCDEIFADAEEACAKGDWAAAEKAFALLNDQLEKHFASEEDILFPAFEAATGMRSGPTEVMRVEHRQMSDLLTKMKGLLAARSVDDFGGAAETLLILMQQHNLKEENILYPMCDRVLGGSDVAATVAKSLQTA